MLLARKLPAQYIRSIFLLYTATAHPAGYLLSEGQIVISRDNVLADIRHHSGTAQSVGEIDRGDGGAR
jgi:hypothetical protein